MVRVFGLTTGTLAIPLSATEGTVRLATGWAASRSRAVRPGPGRGAKRVAYGGAGSMGEGRVVAAAVPAPVSPAATAHVAATAAMMPPPTGRRTRDRDLIQTLLQRRFVVPRRARPGLAGRSRRTPARVPPARPCCGPDPGPGPQMTCRFGQSPWCGVRVRRSPETDQRPCADAASHLPAAR